MFILPWFHIFFKVKKKKKNPQSCRWEEALHINGIRTGNGQIIDQKDWPQLEHSKVHGSSQEDELPVNFSDQNIVCPNVLDFTDFVSVTYVDA